ncbi:DnaJ C-terminal domain-containing protein [Aestuariivirga litoralis]|uniref:DnaJ C-terminal domain-containing protein n=1 Tax=Aestuariivirga litoralis TaxID=2650924 RepID=UPI0018C5A90E|nr:J domain-containing protein [Aestuariivirga litoralis]
MRDPYEILGVGKSASTDDIRTAYRKLAKKSHPDLNPGDKKAEERFKELNAANDLLSDNEKRAKYDAGVIDAAGNEKPQPRQYYRDYAGAGAANPRYQSSGGFSDFDGFDDVLADMFARQTQARRNARGADVNYRLTVSFLDAINGASQRITLPDGSNLDVKIPAGIETGKSIRLKGKGQPSHGTGGSGDALIEVTVARHPDFTREGNDILLDLPVSIKEAALGGPVRTPTASGAVMLNIPPGSSTGTQMRLKGKGVAGKGDQIVRLKIVMPKVPDAKLNEFLKTWEPEGDPRAEVKS